MRTFQSVVLLSTLLAGAAFADDPPKRDHPPHHQPPPEAFTACAKAAENDACTVTFDSHELQGKCVRLPDQTELACLPPHPPHPPKN